MAQQGFERRRETSRGLFGVAVVFILTTLAIASIFAWLGGEAFAGTGNFRDAVLSAANLGGNSDVVAAACGALAGAHYTASAIPTLWRNSLIKKQLIESCADRLLTQAMLQFSA